MARGRSSTSNSCADYEDLRGASFSRFELLHTFEDERDVQEALLDPGPRFVTKFVARKNHR